MRMTELLAPTLREDPAEAEVVSHKLLLRGGFIKKLAAGIYTYLPLGYKVLSKVITIIKEEMTNAGAQEVFMPALQPAELWQETGRWNVYGKELFRIKDRHERDFCLGPTHEEIITNLVKDAIKSYKQLPINLFQIQTKFRDEIRPRFGLMRGREFLMKDAYSFHTGKKSLDLEYKNMHATYCRIFDRLGLDYRVVQADSGAIGGGYSQEFMVLAETGEEEIFHCNQCDYAASRESAGVSAYKLGEGTGAGAGKGEDKVKEVKTPKVKTIEEVVAFLKTTPEKMIKTLIYETEHGPVAGLVRGDHAINEAKLKKILGVDQLTLATPKVIEQVTKAPVGFAGPVGLKKIKIVADTAVTFIELGITGANKKDCHLINVSFGEDYKADLVGDIRYALHQDVCAKCGSGKYQVQRGIEVGHIFKLGTKYSAKMSCNYLDEKNQEQLMLMGCYGIGVSRVAQAAIEQSHDKDGIIWPKAIAPFSVALVPINAQEKAQMDVAEKIYSSCKACFADVLIDDRDLRVGAKLKDMDLIGIPLKVIIGPKGLKDGVVEIKSRRDGKVDLVKIDQVVTKLSKIIKE